MMISILLTFSLLAAPDTLAPAPKVLSEAQLLCMDAADSHESYDFAAAVDFYEDALDLTADSVRTRAIDSLLLFSRNALSLTEVCVRPKVLARQRFSADGFISYYPLPEDARRRLQNPVDTLILRGDSLEVFYPLESDGYLYFSSRELFGIGGYDLYRCRKNDISGELGRPENLGFPFNSPADDFLLYNTQDGRFTIFASSRGCTPDSVNLYVLKYEPMPVHEAIREPAALAALCRLNPSDAGKKLNSGEQAALRDYKFAGDTLSRHNKQLDAMRRRYSSASAAEKQFLSGEISRLEAGLPELVRRRKAAALKMEEMGIKEPAESGWSFKKYPL